MNKPIHILSLGAGVQSSAILLMEQNGKLPQVLSGAIFADTQSEPKSVYRWLDWLEKQAKIPIYRVTNGSVADDGLVVYTSKKSGKRYIKSIIPAFTLQPDGKRGLLGRKCTADYKVKVIIKKINELIAKPNIQEWKKINANDYREFCKYIRDLAIVKKANKLKPKHDRLSPPDFPASAWLRMQENPLAVSWIGISSDEAGRMKESKVPWIKNEWPLIDCNMSRNDCIQWMKSYGFPEPPRSACTFCPFHSDEEWLRLKTEEPDEFQKAVEYEKKLQGAANRQNALTGIPFLHGDCKPLSEIDFSEDKPGYRQIDMFGNECEGLCGV